MSLLHIMTLGHYCYKNDTILLFPWLLRAKIVLSLWALTSSWWITYHCMAVHVSWSSHTTPKSSDLHICMVIQVNWVCVWIFHDMSLKDEWIRNTPAKSNESNLQTSIDHEPVVLFILFFLIVVCISVISTGNLGIKIAFRTGHSKAQSWMLLPPGYHLFLAVSSCW